MRATDGRVPLTHRETLDFIEDFVDVLHSLVVGRGHRVALVLKNGPELALAIIACAQWTRCIPLSPTRAVQELEADLLRCGPDLITGPYSSGPSRLRGCVCDLQRPRVRPLNP